MYIKIYFFIGLAVLVSSVSALSAERYELNYSCKSTASMFQDDKFVLADVQSTRIQNSNENLMMNFSHLLGKKKFSLAVSIGSQIANQFHKADYYVATYYVLAEDGALSIDYSSSFEVYGAELPQSFGITLPKLYPISDKEFVLFQLTCEKSKEK